MLVLRRKVGESIVIGDNVTVRIVGIEGDQVKIGIEAPKTVVIHRQEVYEAIQEENKLAGANAGGFDIAKLKSLSTELK